MKRPLWAVFADRSDRRDQESGYVAIVMAVFMLLLFAMAAFAVDVGNWYFTGQRLQKAADAGALAGVPYLPATPTQAYDIAKNNVANNGFIAPGYAGAGETSNATVTTSLAGSPTRLRVTVESTVENVFGGLLGISDTTIVRTAVADYSGPIPLGSPCNTFGNDPEKIVGRTGDQCDDVKGQLWANIGAIPVAKTTGDPFQDTVCTPSSYTDQLPDGCAGPDGPNTDYAPDGYFYSVTLNRPVSNLVLEAFDPALIDVGDLCDKNLLNATAARNGYVSDETTRYQNGTGPSKPHCTGDIAYDGTGEVTTEFTIRRPVSTTNPWDPLTYPVYNPSGCTKRFTGFSGDLAIALNQTSVGYSSYVASVFRRWQTLCTISYVPAGQYLVQVKTNGLGTDAASGQNRFSLRAYSATDTSAANAISISGHTKMGIYANLPSAQTEFYLSRLPSGAAGQTFTVRLFDTGDVPNNAPGTIKVNAPKNSGVTFTNCTEEGPAVAIVNCSIVATRSLFEGKWQTITLVVPPTYKCVDTDPNACWVTLSYDYGAGAQPNDTTAWTASLEGDPVRLVE